MSVLAALTLHKMQQEGVAFNMDIDIIGTPDEKRWAVRWICAMQGCSKNTILPLWCISTAKKRVLTHNSWHSTASVLSITGKPAHAAGEPWNGINAVNGVQLAIHAMDMMRQQVRPETRVGTWIIAGGTASNVIPAFGELEVTVRHTEREYLNCLSEQIKNIFEGGCPLYRYNCGCRVLWQSV